MMHGRGKSDSAIVAGKPTKRRSDPLRSRWSQGRRPRGMRTSKARTGHSAGQACHRRWHAYGKPQGLLVRTRGGSRMRESRMYGSVRGARGNSCPYRDRCEMRALHLKLSRMSHCSIRATGSIRPSPPQSGLRACCAPIRATPFRLWPDFPKWMRTR
jgi:hypothetical protein